MTARFDATFDTLDQSLDYAARKVRFISQAPPDFLDEILELIATCLQKQ